MDASPDTPSVSTVLVAAGTTAAEALQDAGVDLVGPNGAVVVMELSSRALRDLAWRPPVDAEVQPVPADSDEGLSVIRHSAAHVMAQAVQDLFPGTLLGIGPPIQDGFYYDFAPDRPFEPDDLPKIEKRMQEIIKAGQRFERREISDDDARVELAHERFKLELIDIKGSEGEHEAEVGAGQLTMYDNVDAKSGDRVWTDLCRGPHLPTTRRIPAFKLMRTAAAYWRGSEKNPQLQRIYGTAWASRDDLKDYLVRLDEAAKRDHRKLGVELDLFSFPDEIGSGLPVFHPKGGVIKREMEDYVRRRHIEEGFEYVGTPHITKEGLFHTSGHLPYYADGMFPPLDVDGSEYRLKAMNCPMHNLIYRSRGRSYRELPLRLFEFGHVYRYEKSGVVHGLTRVRGFAQDDSHSYVEPEQAAGRDQAPAELLPRPLPRLRSGRLLPRAVDPRRLQARQVRRVRRGLGRRHRRAEAGRGRVRVAARSGPGRRGVLRAEDLGAGAGTRSGAPGRCRLSSTTSTSRRVSSWSTRPRTVRESSRS